MVPFRSNRSALWLLVLAAVAGCGVEKSENPLSPSVAGPIAGVEISAPRATEPAPGTKLKHSQQPIRLTVANANTNGMRPLSYTFEVASDSAFQSKVFARSSVTPGTNGNTTVTLEPLIVGKGYYWRARAEDGANTGPFVMASFEVLPQPELSVPTLLSPINNERVGSLRPTLTAAPSTRNAAVGPLTYEGQVAIDVAFAQIIAAGSATESGGHVTFVPTELLPNHQHFWRVRATDGETTTAWSPTQTFTTPAAAPPPPPPPSPGPVPGASCASNSGPAIVACVSAKYPERRAPVGSLSQRQENMMFLRDRIIEAGKCGGLDLGWNLKRGGPEISIDFLAWRRSDGSMGVDLGMDYDNIGITLQLYWGEAGIPNTFYTPYPGAFSCS